MRQRWAVKTQEASSQALRMWKLYCRLVRIHHPFSRWPITWSTEGTASSSTCKHGWKKKPNYGNSSKVGGMDLLLLLHYYYSVSVFKLTCENVCSLKSEIISAHHQCAQRPSYLQLGLEKCMHGLQTDLDLQLNSWPLLKRSSLVLEPTSRILL